MQFPFILFSVLMSRTTNLDFKAMMDSLHVYIIACMQKIPQFDIWYNAFLPGWQTSIFDPLTCAQK